jgi:hypothetical protein
MNDQESTGVSRYVAWDLVGLIILVGVSIATSLIFFRFSLVRQHLRTLPFLSIPFWLARGYLLDIYNLHGSKIVVLALEEIQS